MAYIKQNWTNKKPITPDSLNHIEDGIANNNKELESKISAENGKWVDIDKSNFNYDTNLNLNSAKYNEITKEIWLSFIGTDKAISNTATIVTFNNEKYKPSEDVFIPNCGAGLWQNLQDISSIPAIVSYCRATTDGNIKIYFQANSPVYYLNLNIRYSIK